MSGFDYKPIDVQTPEVGNYLSDNNGDASFTESVQKPDTQYVDLEEEPKAEEVAEVKPAFAKNIVKKGEYFRLDADYDKIIDIFGGQLDSHGQYPNDSEGCDNYARGYAIYLQTGNVPSYESVGASADGMEAVCETADSRSGQAQIAFDIVSSGKPCVIHVNSAESRSGQGHWLCVVGFKDGVTRENITVGDLLVIDSAAPGDISAKVRPVSDESGYCIEGFERCSSEPGYHVYYYK